MFGVLFFCGLLLVFFHSLALGAGNWMKKSLTFLPVFLCAGVLLAAGILLIRIYHDEIKEKPISYKTVLGKSWEIMAGASYFSVPIILVYLLLWMILGVFLLFEQLPGIGPVFGVLLAFGPFLINLAAILLCIANVAMLFFGAPAFALKGFSGSDVFRNILVKFKKDIFSGVVLGLISVIPFVAGFIILMMAVFMSGPECVPNKTQLFFTVRRFILMIPFVALLSPTVIFFFNFAAESHVLLMKKSK